MRAVGDAFENMAQTFLCQQGLTIITTNYTVHRVGEIDIIARQDTERFGKVRSVVVFIEVKMRSSKAFGQAVDMVTPTKQQKLIRTAEHYLAHHDVGDAECRFDVVGIQVGDVVDISWVQNAFFADR